MGGGVNDRVDVIRQPEEAILGPPRQSVKVTYVFLGDCSATSIDGPETSRTI